MYIFMPNFCITGSMYHSWGTKSAKFCHNNVGIQHFVVAPPGGATYWQRDWSWTQLHNQKPPYASIAITFLCSNGLFVIWCSQTLALKSAQKFHLDSCILSFVRGRNCRNTMILTKFSMQKWTGGVLCHAELHHDLHIQGRPQFLQLFQLWAPLSLVIWTEFGIRVSE